jgi:tRNA 2-thiouridine synthesizing protein D
MIFTLLIQESPFGHASSRAALRFATAVLAEGHSLFRVFFFSDGVLNATRLNCPVGGEPDLPRAWQDLAAQHGVDMVSCVSSSLRRGIVDVNEAKRYALADSSLREGFALSGLGQMVEACIRSDRVLSFGG